MRSSTTIVVICAIFPVLPAITAAQEKGVSNQQTVAALYPRLTTGVLTFARPVELPEGVIMRAGSVTVSTGDIDKFIAAQPGQLHEQLRKNAFFVLEQQTTGELLLQLAKESLPQGAQQVDGKDDDQIIREYLEKNVLSKMKVTDAEIEQYYRQNKDMFGGATLEQVREPVRQYLLGRKKSTAVTEHIRTVGKRIEIQISALWLKKQAVLAKDNPVDKARESGRVSLVDFGSTGCVPCDMMAPILEDLKAEYEGRLNVLFVHVREDPVLAAVYGIESIPVQVFFDKAGKEVFRHVGFFARDEIEKKLSELGVN